MSGLSPTLAQHWRRLGPGFLPFADAATAELPLGRLLRLSLCQVSVGIAVALLIGTLNRVMIVELGVPAWLVAAVVSMPLVAAPFRAVIGFRSDTHRSVLGWKRVPYIWIGTLLQFGGLAIMPFALIVLSGDANAPAFVGPLAAAFAFLLVGAGLHTTQTCGLALATDLAPPESHPRVVAFLCVMLLAGMVASALVFGALLANFSEVRLIQVVQGSAAVTMALNVAALWKQEARDPARTAVSLPRPDFRAAWQALGEGERPVRRLVAVALGTVGFSMQDVLLEPYGGQVLHLPVSATTALTALLAAGGVGGFSVAAWRLGRGDDPYRLAALGALAGLAAFPTVIAAGLLGSAPVFGFGTAGIGLGGGLFAVGTLMAFVGRAAAGQTGLALGVWGAIQATAAGVAIALSGTVHGAVSDLAARGVLGPSLDSPATGYDAVYVAEIVLLLATLVAVGPLVRAGRRQLPPVPPGAAGRHP
jgi:BCD family chlorophyll transporter-like MFS transporter